MLITPDGHVVHYLVDGHFACNSNGTPENSPGFYYTNATRQVECSNCSATRVFKRDESHQRFDYRRSMEA